MGFFSDTTEQDKFYEQSRRNAEAADRLQRDIDASTREFSQKYKNSGSQSTSGGSSGSSDGFWSSGSISSSSGGYGGSGGDGSAAIGGFIGLIGLVCIGAAAIATYLPYRAIEKTLNWKRGKQSENKVYAGLILSGIYATTGGGYLHHQAEVERLSNLYPAISLAMYPNKNQWYGTKYFGSSPDTNTAVAQAAQKCSGWSNCTSLATIPAMQPGCIVAWKGIANGTAKHAFLTKKTGENLNALLTQNAAGQTVLPDAVMKCNTDAFYDYAEEKFKDLVRSIPGAPAPNLVKVVPTGIGFGIDYLTLSLDMPVRPVQTRAAARRETGAASQDRHGNASPQPSHDFYLVTAGSGLNIRAQPTSESRKKGNVAEGSCVSAFDNGRQIQHGFIQATAKDRDGRTVSGYMSLDYLRLVTGRFTESTCRADLK